MTSPTVSQNSSQDLRPAAREGRGQAASLHRLARIIFLATIFAAPWTFGAVQPWGWGALTVLAMLLLILWAAGWVERGILKLSWSSLYLPFLALIALALFQFFAGFTSDHVASREAVLKLVTNAVFFFLAGQLLFNESRSGKTIQQWGLLVLILALGLSALAIAQVITTGHGWIYWYIRTPHGPFGPYVSANDYCGLLEMLIPVAAGYVLSGSSRRVPAVLLWIAVGVALASVAMSGSRGGAVVTLIEVLLFAYIAIRHQSRRHWGLGLPVILGLILISAGAFAWVANGQRETDRALSVFQTNKSLQVKMGDRLWVAKDTLRMALHHPWLGVGVGGFERPFRPTCRTFPTSIGLTRTMILPRDCRKPVCPERCCSYGAWSFLFRWDTFTSASDYAPTGAGFRSGRWWGRRDCSATAWWISICAFPPTPHGSSSAWRLRPTPARGRTVRPAACGNRLRKRMKVL